MTPINSISVKSLCADPLVERIARIMENRISQRSSVEFHNPEPDLKIYLDLKKELGRDAYEAQNKPGLTVISGGNIHGLYAGVGKFLRTCEYIGDRFIRSTISGQSKPDCMLRGVHIADAMDWTSYHRMPDEKYQRYIEDLALYGYINIVVNYSFISQSSLERVKRKFKIISELGLKTGLFLPPNLAVKVIQQELLAKPFEVIIGTHLNTGAAGRVCPSKKGGIDHIVASHEKLFNELREYDLDSILLWPYDPGGCCCKDCAPWGGNGFIKASRAVGKLAKKYFPKVKCILSTWGFGDDPEAAGGEWEALNKYLEKDNDFIDVVMSDNQMQCLDVNLCRYDIPSKIPVIGFPDVTMWGLGPWGGYGAVVNYKYQWRRWNESTGTRYGAVRIRKYLLQGGMPYSEGIFTDTGQFLYSQLYWDRDAEGYDVMREYFNYECGTIHSADIVRIIDLIEYNHVRQGNGVKSVYKKAQEALELAKKTDVELPGWAKKNWRWRLIYIRALLDENRYNQDNIDFENEKVNWTKEALDAYRELEEIYDYGPKQRVVLGLGCKFESIIGKSFSGEPPVEYMDVN